MNSDGYIEIEVGEIDGLMNSLSKSYSILKDNCGGVLPGEFSLLSDIGLFTTGIEKIRKQVDLLSEKYQDLVTQIPQHIAEYVDDDNQYASLFDNGASGNINYVGSGISSSNNFSESNMDSNESDGKKINSTYLIENIPKLSVQQNRQMLKILDINKPNGVTLSNLLFSSSLSKHLYVSLKKVFGDYSDDVTGVTDDDYKAVQKTIIKSIFSGKIDTQKLENDSILLAKEYLLKITKENNIDISDLLLEDSYNTILKKALVNLYNGQNIEKYNLSKDEVTSFRYYVDELAIKNKITAEVLFNDKFELII